MAEDSRNWVDSWDDHEFYHIDDNKRQPRVMIEQVDGDKFYFPDESNARQFIEFHGLKPIPSEELERLREAEAPRPEDDDE